MGAADEFRLPPCGGSGLKFGFKNPKLASITGLPPCGGSGLKYKTNTKSTRLHCLPPCGGSGLK